MTTPDVLTIILQRQDILEKKIDKITDSVNLIANAQAEQKGARKATLYMVSMVSGTLGALLTAVFHAVVFPGAPR